MWHLRCRFAHFYHCLVIEYMEYLVIGLDDGIDFTVDATTGGAKADLNGYTLTGVATTKDMAPHLDTATISAFLALVA